ncbi:hypothetical protein Tco_1103709 [Tanacetum coccineum]
MIASPDGGDTNCECSEEVCVLQKIHRDLKDWILLLLLKIQDKIALSNRHPCSKWKDLIISSYGSWSGNILISHVIYTRVSTKTGRHEIYLMLVENISHDVWHASINYGEIKTTLVKDI